MQALTETCSLVSKRPIMHVSKTEFCHVFMRHLNISDGAIVMCVKLATTVISFFTVIVMLTDTVKFT